MDVLVVHEKHMVAKVAASVRVALGALVLLRQTMRANYQTTRVDWIPIVTRGEIVIYIVDKAVASARDVLNMTVSVSFQKGKTGGH